MFKSNYYEIIYSLEKLYAPQSLPPKPTGLERHYERAKKHPGSLLDADFSNKGFETGFSFRNGLITYHREEDSYADMPWWKKNPPFLPDSTGDAYNDAWKEYELVQSLNESGNAQAREAFIAAQWEMLENLNEDEKDLLTLPEFVANETLILQLQVIATT